MARTSTDQYWGEQLKIAQQETEQAQGTSQQSPMGAPQGVPPNGAGTDPSGTGNGNIGTGNVPQAGESNFTGPIN